MKTLKFLLIAAAITATLPSCLKKTEIPSVSAYFTNYIIQDETAEGTRYLPHLGFEYSGKEEFERGEILFNDEPMNDPQHDAGFKVYQINPEANVKYDITDLSGTYTMGPTGVDGGQWIRTLEFEFTGDERLEKSVVTEFGYKDGNIYAIFEKAGNNALAYGFYLQPLSNGAPTKFYSIPLNHYLGFSVDDTQITTQTVWFDPTDLFYQAERYRITPAAFNHSEKSMTVMRLAITKDGNKIYRDMDYEDLTNGVFYKYGEEPGE